MIYFTFAPILQVAYAATDMMLADKAPDFTKGTRDILVGSPFALHRHP
jgi:hypothetical protein